MAQRALLITCHNPHIPISRFNHIRNLHFAAKAFCQDMEMPLRSIMNITLERVYYFVLKFADEVDDSDTVYIFIHSHGDTDGLILGYDKTKSGDDADEHISYDDLKLLLDHIPGHKILLIDACHSGAAIENSVQRTGAFYGDTTYSVLCSCESSEEADCGLATKYWLMGLGWDPEKSVPAKMEADTNANNAVSLKELYLYSKDMVLKKKPKQHVQVFGESANYILMRKYVTQLYVKSHSSKSQARSGHPDGYVLVDRDLNTGAGGNYIYLSYKLGPASQALTHLLCSYFDHSMPAGNVTLIDQDKTSATYYRIGVDLNQGAGGKKVYLNASRTTSHKPITNVGVVFGGATLDRGWSVVNWDNGKGYADVNKKAGGKYIYIIERH